MLADLLVTSGDPRGEFIQLQMAIADGRGTKPMETRASQLLTEHGKTWSAPFAGAPVEYRGGFPYRVLAHVVEPLRRDWATVEELEYSGIGDLTPLLARAPLIHTLFVRASVAPALRGPFPSVRSLSAGGWLPPDRAVFPNLAVLAGRFFWHAGALEGLHDAQRRARELELDAVVHYCLRHVPDQIAEVVRARSLGPRESRCAVVGDAGGLVHHGWYLRTWRDRDDAIVGFRASNWFETHTARQVIEPLIATGIRRIALAIPLPHRARAGRELAQLYADMQRAGVEIGEAPPSDVLAPATVGE